MDFDRFFNELMVKCRTLNIELSKNMVDKFYRYMNLLIEWNEKINLTAIVEPNNIILKHFVDSLSILKNINKEASIVDIGTGAGFPGLPIAIASGNCNITLVDSLNKRINFLNEVINDISLNNVNTIHSRAEDFGKDKSFRESFDFAVSRAVAPMNILLEYMLPIVEIGGICICMKSFNVDDELESAKRACDILGGRIEGIDEVILPDTDIIRKNIIIRKVKETPSKYPRKAGIPSKDPI